MFRRSVVAVVSTVALLASLCSPPAFASSVHEELTAPSQPKVVAAVHTVSTTGVLEFRPSFVPRTLVSAWSAEETVPSLPILSSLRADVSQPPSRRIYRRLVHGDRSDLPA